MRIRALFIVLCTALPILADQQPLYLEYIRQYKSAALEQQRLHKIPASITMAQGLLESGAGKSELAVQANNHFGIKCTSDWKGETYRHDDENRHGDDSSEQANADRGIRYIPCRTNIRLPPQAFHFI